MAIPGINERPLAKLYSPELLSLATGLASYPLNDGFSCTADARSPTCGSTISLGLNCADDGSIELLGMRATACAVGQASAAIFAQSAEGRSRSDIETVRNALNAWLRDANEMPNWPNIKLLAPALEYPARHPAILLVWNAAAEALCNAEMSS